MSGEIQFVRAGISLPALDTISGDRASILGHVDDHVVLKLQRRDRVAHPERL